MYTQNTIIGKKMDKLSLQIVINYNMDILYIVNRQKGQPKYLRTIFCFTLKAKCLLPYTEKPPR